MTYTVYIIYSAILDQYYTGHTDDMLDRLYRHTNSGSKSTRKASDWKLVYTELFDTKSGAVKRELEIKRKKSRKYTEWLINGAG